MQYRMIVKNLTVKRNNVKQYVSELHIKFILKITTNPSFSIRPVTLFCIPFVLEKECLHRGHNRLFGNWN